MRQTLALVFVADYETSEELLPELRANLHVAVANGVENGILTGDSEAELLVWDAGTRTFDNFNEAWSTLLPYHPGAQPGSVWLDKIKQDIQAVRTRLENVSTNVVNGGAEWQAVVDVNKAWQALGRIESVIQEQQQTSE